MIAYVRKPFAGHTVGERLEVTAEDFELLSRVGRLSERPTVVERKPSFQSRRGFVNIPAEVGPTRKSDPGPESHQAGPRVTVEPLGRGWYVVALDGKQETREDGTIARRREGDAYEHAARLAAQPAP